jgi:hypothetical protein
VTTERAPSLRASAGIIDRYARFLFSTIVAVLALACLAGLWRVAAVLGLRVPLDPNEGWNAYHTAAAMAGHGPYPAAGSFMTNNYPPLSFYLVGMLGNVLGDNIVTGRIVSLLSFLAVGGGITVLARQFGCGKLEAAFASLIFTGFLLVYSDYVGMDDPQLFGHALQVCALLLLFAEKKSLSIELESAALFVAALFVKHNLIVAPFAALIWLSLHDVRRARRIAVFMLGFGLVGLAACRIAFGVNLISVLNSPRSYSPALFAANFRDWLVPAAIPLTAALAAATTRDRFAQFCAIYAVTGVAIGGAFLGGAGVDANAMFDADIVFSLGAGIAFSRIGMVSRERPALARSALALALVIPLALGLWRSFDPAWLDDGFWLHPLREDAETARADISYLQTQKGPAVCEMLSLCYWAGKPATVDVFNLDQQFLTGARDERAFIKAIDARSFAVIQVDSPASLSFPAAVQSAIERNYRIDATSDNGAFMVPRARS